MRASSSGVRRFPRARHPRSPGPTLTPIRFLLLLLLLFLFLSSLPLSSTSPAQPPGAVSDLDWGDREQVNKLLLTPEQHCDYKFLAHVEGLAYSGRLKYLTQCRSVIVVRLLPRSLVPTDRALGPALAEQLALTLFPRSHVLQAHKMRYVQHFHHLFNSDPSSPAQNLVTVPGHHFDELPSVMDELLADDARAKQIADTSYAFWRHWLSVGSVDCYWRRLFREWRDVMAFEPVVTRNLTSYNSFMCVVLFVLPFCRGVHGVGLSSRA